MPLFSRPRLIIPGMIQKKNSDKTSAWLPVYEWVRRIPRGRVMTYGQISDLLGGRLSAAAVGWALNACPKDVPWQRVVNAAGQCSVDRDGPPRQQRRLEREGVRFSPQSKIDLAHYQWHPDEAEWDE